MFEPNKFGGVGKKKDHRHAAPQNSEARYELVTGTWTRYELGGASEEPRRALPRSDLVTRRLRASENARRRLGANGGGSEQARSTSEQTEVVRSKLGAPRSKGRWFGASSEHLGGQWKSERIGALHRGLGCACVCVRSIHVCACACVRVHTCTCACARACVCVSN